MRTLCAREHDPKRDQHGREQGERGNERVEAQRFGESNEQAFATAVRRTGTRAMLTAFVIIGVFGFLLWSLYGGVQAVVEGRTTAGTLSQTALYIALIASSVAVLAEGVGRSAARLGRDRAADGAARCALADR